MPLMLTVMLNALIKCVNTIHQTIHTITRRFRILRLVIMDQDVAQDVQFLIPMIITTILLPNLVLEVHVQLAIGTRIIYAIQIAKWIVMFMQID